MLFEGFGGKGGGRLVRRMGEKTWRKKLQNKFGISRKCFYLCSPNKNGKNKSSWWRDAWSDKHWKIYPGFNPGLNISQPARRRRNVL